LLNENGADSGGGKRGGGGMDRLGEPLI